MLSIYKYPLESSLDISLLLPKDAEVLTLKVQYNQPCLWILVDPNQKIFELRHFRAFATGDSIENIKDLIYIETFLLYDRKLVYHLFEEIERGKDDGL